MRIGVRLALLVLGLVLVACSAPGGAGRQANGGAPEPARKSPKRITIALLTEPPSLHYNLIPNPIRASTGSIQELVHPGLAVSDNEGTLRPVLAEAVPSIENGLWKLLPDGGMETTWRIRDGAIWHDGTPVTSGDLELTVSLTKDRELAVFRDAETDEIDRQALADNLMAGLLPISESPLFPDTPEYKATAPSIVHYAYAPQRSVQMIEGLGYARGSDGIFRDAAGQRLSFETRTTAQRDLHLKTMLPVVDSWQRLGLEVETQVIPAARATDREEQATFPGFQVLRQPAGVDRLVRYHSNEARTAERNFTGNNNGRYMNPELDRLIDRLNVSLEFTDRMVVASQIIQHVTDQLPVLSLFFDATPTLVHNRMRNITPLSGHEDARVGWNSQQWDVQ